MKALTIWQPWATLVMALAKPYEFRGGSYLDPKRYRDAPRPGDRIVVHAGARPIKRAEVQDIIMRCRTGETALNVDLALPILERVLTSPGMLPLAAGLGTAVIGPPQRSVDLFRDRINPEDSDRIDHQQWAWPLSEIERFNPIRPCRGLQGFWNWPADLMPGQERLLSR